MNKLLIVVLACLSLAGCTSLHNVPLNQEPLDSNSLSQYVGNDVIITTISGEEIEFRVKSADDVSIYGKEAKVDIADIKKMKVAKFSFGKTLGLGGGAVAATFFTVFTIAILSI